jgi:hypothetical protein
MDDMPGPELLNKLSLQSARTWWGCQKVNLPLSGRSYTSSEQAANEEILSRRIDVLAVEVESIRQTRPGLSGAFARLVDCTGDLVELVYGLERRLIETLQASGMVEATEEFVRQARQYDPDLSPESIYQAARNVWSMNLLQLQMELPVEVTPSVFAYSLLYPYTDNFLDDPNTSPEEKDAFNERFRQRLAGKDSVPVGRNETIIFDLVSMIEGQYPRSSSPQVYASLLAIHYAQSRSLHLLKRSASPYEVDVLGICFEKGGASVLADGYLLAGALSPEQQLLLFQYGAFTQLVDDLQDVTEDRENGLMTVFSTTAGRWPLDGLTDRTLCFGYEILDAIGKATSSGFRPFVELMTASLLPLVAETVFLAQAHYSLTYLDRLQEFFPVRRDFLEEQRQRLNLPQESLPDLFGALMPLTT